MMHTRLNFRRSTAAVLLSTLLFGLASVNTGAQSSAQRATAAQRRVAVEPSSSVQRVAPKPSSQQTSPRPRLVLLIVVDQFRADYLERFGDLFAPNGLRRLMRDGAMWADANFDHTPTYTAPGHATMMTGTWPAENGIIGNEWYDRETGKRVTSVSDETAVLFAGGDKEVASSPRRLLASTVGDELRLATNDRAKVIGISVKDRAAILPVGRHANAAYWFSAISGQMVSSNYYFNQLPAWVTAFNAARPADKFFGAKWERLLPNETEYLRRAGPDAPVWENILTNKDTNTFPHMITGGATAPGRDFYGALDVSPFSNDLLVSFAEQAIDAEQLGQDADTDVLSVSFSANDYVGHRFGPYSQEVMDITLRVDRQIGALLDYVDRRVGLQNTVVAFTADHGVAPIPEHASLLGLTGGRINSNDVLLAMRNAVKARYARPEDLKAGKDTTADYILEPFLNGNLEFSPAALKRDGVSRAEIERVAGEAALTVPGITRYFTRTQLEGGFAAADPLARRVLHGFNPRRSGDVIVVYEPFKYLVEGPIPATHGSPYSYDTHVPLIIMGRGLAPGRYAQAATPADLAPTLSALLHVQSPSNATGRVLLEALNPNGK